MCPTLQKLGHWLVCSSPSSQLDVSSDEKGGSCFTPSPEQKNLPRMLCVSFPHAQSGTKLSLGMWTLLLGWMYLETDALPKVCCLLWG